MTFQHPLDQCEAHLLAAMTSMAPSGIRVGCRVIRAGDNRLLLPGEQLAVTTRDPAARRASGAARHLARGLMAGFDLPPTAIGRAVSGRPVWPEGIAGSLAHDRDIAVAAVTSSLVVPSLGIDVEPAEPLPDDAAGLVVTAGDEAGVATWQLAGRVLFASKEAIYKAAFPLDGIVLNYDEVVVDVPASRGRTRTGHEMTLFLCLSPRIVVLAIPRV
jgi:4'-phosphopantetheinyl transferase EntD